MTNSSGPYALTLGGSPLILSQPHPGLNLAPGMEERLTDEALRLPDTDWHIPALYRDVATELDATVISADFSRYVIDLNRDPGGTSLYPGQSVTELCPTSLFDNTPLYKSNRAPDETEINARQTLYWQPYHDELAAQINRIHKKHGYAILYDCHSIRSAVPRFFDGILPDLNVGTGNGSSIDLSAMKDLTNILSNCNYSNIINGRFKGGYITRHYGDPQNNIHAMQMEIAQSTYMMEEHPFTYDQVKAAKLKPLLRTILLGLVNWGQQSYSQQEGQANDQQN